MTRISPRTLRRVNAGARVALGLVVASTFLGTGAAAHAQDPAPPASLGGYSGSAAASGIHAIYAPEGLLPTGPPLDLGAPDALATIASGPATFARASVADPGDLLANPGALLALASPDYPPGLIPPYPFRIAVSSGVGAPTAESNPAPGLHAKVAVEPGSSSAEATTPVIDVPAVAIVGSMRATATTETDGTTVTVHARSEIGPVDILGLVHIEAVVTDLTATSSGGETTLEGGTTVIGATLLDQAITIDDEGVRGAFGLGEILDVLGIRVTLPGPVELAGGNSGQLASTGLRIDIELSPDTVPGLGDLLDSLPPIPPLAPGAPGIEDIIAVAQARHLASVEIGRGVVSLTGRGSATRAPATTPTTTARPASPTRPGAAVTRSPAVAATPPRVVTPTPVASSPVAAAPAASTAAGVGALAIVLLLFQPLIGDRLARVAAAQLASDQEGCPWERP